MLKLFLVNDEGHECGWGRHAEGFLVVAANEEEVVHHLKTYQGEYSNAYEIYGLDRFTIRCIGEAAKDVKSGVLLDSFAGE